MTDANSFVAAIHTGDLGAVQRSLAADPTLARCRDESGVSVICLAVYFGRDEIASVLARARDDLDIFEASTLGEADRVRQLISSAPALINSYSPDGFHPLGYACFFGRRDVFEVLLDAGAELEAPARNPMQVMPLHSAVAQSDPDAALFLAQRLLEKGASPNVVQHGGFTPLHEAALRGHVELVRLLLRHGANPSARNSERRSPSDLAREKGHKEVVSLLEVAA